jgi:hypothetical protein
VSLGVIFCGWCVGSAELCAVLCVACVRRCACSDACAVRSGCGCAGRRAGVRGLCVCMLCVSVRSAVRGLFVCAVLGDTRHDVVLWWVGLVASCASVRACAWCDGSGERGASSLVCARGARWACEGVHVKSHGCVIRAMCNACLGRALPALFPAQ